MWKPHPLVLKPKINLSLDIIDMVLSYDVGGKEQPRWEDRVHTSTSSCAWLLPQWQSQKVKVIGIMFPDSSVITH